MKRSVLGVLVAASVVAFSACRGNEANDDVEPVEDVMQPAPAPTTPPPATTTTDTTAADTMRDTTATTTRQ